MVRKHIYIYILFLLHSFHCVNGQFILDFEPIPGLPIYEDDYFYVSATISDDGQKMIALRTTGEEKDLEFVLFEKTDNNWSEGKLLSLINNALGNLHWTSAVSFNSSGDRIYYTAPFYGSEGYMDVYYSDFTNGIWSAPINPGKQINSARSEMSASINPAGNNLYYHRQQDGEKDGILKIHYNELQSNGTWGPRKIWNESLNFYHTEHPVVFRDNAMLIYAKIKKKDDHQHFLTTKQSNKNWTTPVQYSFKKETLVKYGNESDNQPRYITTNRQFNYLILGVYGKIYRSIVPEPMKALANEVTISQNKPVIMKSETSPVQMLEKEYIEKRTALVIGNANYSIGKLKNSVNDANLMASELELAGFKVIKVLDADLATMKEAVRTFGDELIKNSGVGLFYYSGHGLQTEGRNFLVPINANISRGYEVIDECLDASRILRMMKLYDNPMNIIILDACRNNPFASKYRSVQTGLATPEVAPTGSIIAFSTAPGKTASDGDGEHGLYTRELVKAMRIPGLKIEDIFKKVRINVQKESNNEQSPWENSSLTGNFYFYKE